MVKHKSFKLIWLIELYIILTIVFYFIGPIAWKTPNVFKLVAFLVSCMVMLFAGFKTFYSRKRNHTRDAFSNPFNVDDNLLINGVCWMLFLNLIINTLYLIRCLGENTLSISNIILWITNPSQQYMSKFIISSSSVFGKVVGVMTTFSSFFLWPTIPFGLLFYKKLSSGFKILLITNIIVELLRWFAMGTNKGIIDVILLLLCIILYKTMQNRIRVTKKVWIIIAVAFLVVIGLSYFTNNITGRVDGSYTLFLNNLNGNHLKENSILTDLFPGLTNTLVYAHSYITQGYYGLSLCMEVKEFTPMFGIGHSSFLIENFNEIFGGNFFQKTYMYKANSLGWNSSSCWHTAFAWFANDVSFWGVPFVMFLIGYYFAFVSFYLFEEDNKMFFPMFCMMMQMFFYLSMNNQIFASPFSFMGFVGMNLNFLCIRYGIFRSKKINLNYSPRSGVSD